MGLVRKTPCRFPGSPVLADPARAAQRPRGQTQNGAQNVEDCCAIFKSFAGAARLEPTRRKSRQQSRGVARGSATGSWPIPAGVRGPPWECRARRSERLFDAMKHATRGDETK